ncbi:uncharacterized protein LOC124405728 [Diprion similis]|uniref:uncharacterized protein LOC124405728 n=1 Tax=Diprion similis TaxID=362088 RepID=UPI001EF8F938|nr:uncharacterized protein LOC124405728 [Diprion similis]
MEANQEPSASNNGSAITQDCNEFCNAEATGSTSTPPTSRNFDAVQKVPESLEAVIKYPMNPSPGTFKHTVRGTQTPLTLIGVTMSKSNEENQKPPLEVPEILEAEIPSRTIEGPEPSTSVVKSVFSQFRVEAVTVKFSHEAATQATPPHPSLTSTRSSTLPMNVMQIATSVSSNRSGPKSEVLTVTTDYGTRTPDARSLLLDVIEQEHPIRYINVEPSTSAIAVTSSSPVTTPGLPNFTMSPPSINSQRSLLNLQRRRPENRWSCGNCFRRNIPQGEEVWSRWN